MERLIAAAALLFLCVGTAQADAMGEIRARLDAHPLVRAEFVQTRTIKDLERPFVSRGRMLAWGAGGVIWQVEQPVRVTYVLRDDSTIEIAADGTRSVRRAHDDRGAARIGRVLRAVLKGDARTLDEWFEAEARISGERWTLVLTPRQGPMASFVKSVQISGGEFVDGVRILEQSGDATQMQFRNLRAGDAPSDEERRLLAGD
jgi:Outer membrane lipoprotein carrier protein LolA-like